MVAYASTCFVEFGEIVVLVPPLVAAAILIVLRLMNFSAAVVRLVR